VEIGRAIGQARHGTYSRKFPIGIKIARWYCRKGCITISKLPDCLSSRLPGTLIEVETVVEKLCQKEEDIVRTYWKFYKLYYSTVEDVLSMFSIFYQTSSDIISLGFL
jgi:hypothetical protein